MTAIIEPAIAQATGSLVGPAIDGGKGIFNCLKRKYGYVRNMSKNFADLEKEEKYLISEEVDVMTKLDRNRLKMQQTNRCKTWLDEVGKLKGEINDLKTEYSSIRKSFCGLCPLPGLMKLGKKILKKTADVVSLTDQIGRITIMFEKAPAAVIKKHTKVFPSLYKHVEMLQEYLRNVELKRICIWGPPGVGKTTIMANLHDAVGESHEFDIIFWVNVNTNRNVKEIQEVLLKRLGLDLKAEEHSNDQRADMISEELKNKKYVLFLDEVSSEINLEEVGIHEHHSDGKVVFACRYRYICGQADEHINVQRLSDEDAWKLFQETVDLDLKNYRDIEPVARKIVNECGGMPHMIKLIGKSLKKVEVAAIWRNTLYQLRSPSMERKRELEEVYKFFKLVCDELAPNKRSCLLSWAIFPAGYEPHRDYIIECWRAEECFKHWSKLGEARDEGHAILNEFVDQSLLENGRKVAHYKMFEHFQRVALRIANQDEKSYRIPVKEGEKIREEEWEPANRISLVRLKEELELPERPKCGKILTLLLQESSLVEFPISFFVFMCSLRLLDLRDTVIRLLPSSISSLKNLTVLFLNNCRELTQLPAEVGDLSSLEVLDIRHTGIHALPIEIGQLTDLKCLRVSFVEPVGNHNQVEARPRDIISSNIIKKIVSLEELIIDLNPNNGRWNQTLRDIAVEVASLENLTCLGFNFPDVDCFQNFINTSKSLNGNNKLLEVNNLRSFSIVIGYHQPCTKFDISGCSAEKHLRFSAGDGFPDAILKMLKEACAFELIGHRTAANLSDFGADKLGGLEACIIEECNEMMSIIDGNHTRDAAFQRLKELHINNLSKLVHIWKGSIQAGSFPVLTTLTLKGCHSLKTLFSQEIVLQLKQLQSLEVEDCKEIEKIIEDGSVVEAKVFPKLKKLELCSLPRLSNICQNMSLEWPSLETTIIKTCEELKNFPSTFESAAKLGVIRCTQDWWNQLVWPNDNVKNRFQSLQKLI
ncbi:hypothetical protein LWI29_027903 [Acer saccharum]|uniref:AAA+ ATPase domain-containing protein n=1 Tax=Acer saccharum TaxID=4024 RepID=A0AA39W958_ACESA|nr:hypothetical protein LWI29_027903 [Acer saccharum]